MEQCLVLKKPLPLSRSKQLILYANQPRVGKRHAGVYSAGFLFTDFGG